MPSEASGDGPAGRRRRWILTGVAALLAWPMARWTTGVWTRDTPPGVGEGRLAACPDRPNCVSSEAEEGTAAHVAPIAYGGTGEEARRRLRQVLRTWPGVEVRKETPDWVWCVVRTRWMGFRDDVELVFDDAAGVIRVRSASRLGYSDLGANRQRIEALRRAYAGMAP
jgi:uncharacterized protein (DUF1499 family)